MICWAYYINIATIISTSPNVLCIFWLIVIIISVIFINPVYMVYFVWNIPSRVVLIPSMQSPIYLIFCMMWNISNIIYSYINRSCIIFSILSFKIIKVIYKLPSELNSKILLIITIWS